MYEAVIVGASALFCGADTDCTCASAASVLGILKGYAAMPQDLRDMVKDRFVMGIAVERTDNTLTALTEDTLRIACGIAQHTAFNPAFAPEGLPASFVPLKWETPAPAVTLTVDYPEKPAIGREDRTPVTLTLCNPLATPLAGRYPGVSVSLRSSEGLTEKEREWARAICFLQ